MPLPSVIRAIADASAARIVGAYFELSYRLLSAPAGREFLRAAAVGDAPAVHGYSTSEDVEAVLDAIQPSATDLLVDLGCGLGEVAVAIHRRTGCRVVGIDAAPDAIGHARRRAAAAGAAASVRFHVGDLRSPPVRGSAAYALDSLMFVPRPPQAIASVSRSLEPPGRILVTFVDHRGLGRAAFARYIEAGGIRVERLEDVSWEFARRSRERAATARRLLRGGSSWTGRLGLRLVLVEEAIVGRLLARGRLRRWRFIVASSRIGPRPGTTSRRRA